jgi:hypothetical protein
VVEVIRHALGYRLAANDAHVSREAVAERNYIRNKNHVNPAAALTASVGIIPAL